MNSWHTKVRVGQGQGDADQHGAFISEFLYET